MNNDAAKIENVFDLTPTWGIENANFVKVHESDENLGKKFCRNTIYVYLCSPKFKGGCGEMGDALL